MKKIFRILALLLVITLVAGCVPVSAKTASFSLKKSSKILYIDGSQGKKEDKTQCKTKNYYKVSSFINGFNKKTMDIKLISADPSIVKTDDEENRIYAQEKIGSTNVSITIYSKKTDKILGSLVLNVKVKKNATELQYSVKDTDGKSIDPKTESLKPGVKYIITMSRKNANGVQTDTDLRNLSAVDDSVKIKAINKYSTQYEVTFTKSGTYILDAYTYQSKLYNAPIHKKSIKVTVQKEIVPAITSAPLVTSVPVITSAPAPTGVTVYHEVKFAPATDETNIGNITLPDTMMAEYGTTIGDIPMTRKTGKVFMGWYYDSALKLMAPSGDIIDRNMTLYPKFGNREGLEGIFAYDYVAKEEVEPDYTVLLAAHNLSADEVKELIRVRNITAGNQLIEFSIESYNGNINGLNNAAKNPATLFDEDTTNLLGMVGIGPDFSKIPDLYALYNLNSDDSPERYWREDLNLSPDNVLLLQNALATIKENAWNNISIFKVVPKSGKWTEGNLQQVEIKNTEALRFVFEGKETEEAIIYNNFKVAKEEYNKLNISKSLIYIPLSETQGIDSLQGLFTFASDGDGQEINRADQNGVLKTSKKLEVGTNIAVYDGTLKEDGTVDGDVGYFKITNVISEGNYAYQSAEFMDVLEFPNVIPVKYSNNPKSGNIILSWGELDFTGKVFETLKLDESTVIKNGDYIWFYSGNLPDTLSELSAQGIGISKITKVTEEAGGLVLEYTESSLEDLHSSSGIYKKVDNIEIPVSESDVEALKASLQKQMVDSQFAEKTGDYIIGLINGDAVNPDDPEMEEALKNLTFKTDAGDEISIDELRLLAAGQNVEVSGLSSGLTLSPMLEHFDGMGIRAVLSAGFTIKIGLNANNIIQIDCVAAVEQEIMLGMDIDVEIDWDVIIPVDATVDASLRAGTYTGFGAQATVITKAENANEDTPWNRLLETTGAGAVDKKTADQLLNLGTNLATMSKNLEKIQGETYTKEKGKQGSLTTSEDAAGPQYSSMGGDLPSKYSSMLENDSEYIDIIDEEIFRMEIGIDPYQIVRFSIGADFVVRFKLNAMLGASISYGNAKQYCYHVQIAPGIAEETTADIEAPNFRIDFFVFGMVGIRAGVRLDVRLGLLSTRFASVGITAEVGIYCELYGFLYMFYSWRSGEGSTSGIMGSLLFEIGAYLTINFKAQLGDDKLNKEVKLYEKTWPFLQLGAVSVPIPHTYEAEDYEELQKVLEIEEGQNTVKVPDAVFGVDMMSLKTGEVSRENQDSKKVGTEGYAFDINGRSYIQYNEEHFEVACYDLDGENGKVTENHSFQYLPATNEIYVKPVSNDTDEIWGIVTFTYRNESFGFSTVEIKRTLKVHWKGTPLTAVVEYYIQNDEGEGYTLQKTGQFDGFDGIEYDIIVDEKFVNQFPGYRFSGVDYPGLDYLDELEDKAIKELNDAEAALSNWNNENIKRRNEAAERYNTIKEKVEGYYENVVNTIENGEGTLYFLMTQNDTLVKLYFDKGAEHILRPINISSFPPENDEFEMPLPDSDVIIYDGQNILESLKKYEKNATPYSNGDLFDWYMAPVSGLETYPKEYIYNENGGFTVIVTRRTFNDREIHCKLPDYTYISKDEIGKDFFDGWQNWIHVTEDTLMPSKGVVLVAHVTQRSEYTITWKDRDGNVIKIDQVGRGKSTSDYVPQIEIPQKAGYKYVVDWINDHDDGKDADLPAYWDITYTAQIREIAEEQPITWLVDGETWKTTGGKTDEIFDITNQLRYMGSDLSRFYMPLEKEGYNMKLFIVEDGDDKEFYHKFIMPAGGVTIKVVYEICSYNATWKDGDSVIKEETVEYGKTLIPPEVSIDTEKEGLVWRIDGKDILSDTMMPAKDIIITTSRHEHNWTDDDDSIKNTSTCTEEGYIERSCTLCDKTKKEPLPIDPEAHVWKETGRDQADCVSPEIIHYVCEHCNITKDVENGSVDPANHKGGGSVHKDKVDATCGENGHKEGEFCTYCEQFISGGAIIHATGEHTYTPGQFDVFVPSTCTEGAIYTQICTVCGYESTTIGQPRGHQWGTVEYVWSDDNKTVTARRVCQNDTSHIEEETVSTNSEMLFETSCSGPGKVKYSAAFNNEVFAPTSKEVEIPQLAHDWDSVVEYTWSADNMTVTAERKCKNNLSHVDKETVTAQYTTTRPATADEDGERVYTAEFTNEAFETQTKTASYTYETIDTPVISSFGFASIDYSLNETADPLTVVAYVQDGGMLTYQWYSAEAVVDGIPVPEPKFRAIDGATGDSYTPSTAIESHKLYYVEVTNTLNGFAAKANSDIIFFDVRDTIKVTFDANGGTFSSALQIDVEVEAETVKVDRGAIFSFPYAQRQGFTCMGWNTDRNATEGFANGGAISETDKPEGDIIYYAIWKEE